MMPTIALVALIALLLALASGESLAGARVRWQPMLIAVGGSALGSPAAVERDQLQRYVAS